MRDPLLSGTVKLPTIEDAMSAGGFLAGRPEGIIDQLKAVEKRYPGLDRVICATPLALRPTSSPQTSTAWQRRSPGLPRHPNRRRGAVDPRISRQVWAGARVPLTVPAGRNAS